VVLRRVPFANPMRWDCNKGGPGANCFNRLKRPKEVRCDKCGSVGLSRRCFYAHQMREDLKAAGWKHVAEGGKDFCPKCKPGESLGGAHVRRSR